MEVCDGQAPLMRAWSCTISTHMRSLGKVLATFDKIGRDLFIEAAPDRLLLRTLNQAQSVFCLCTLPLALFDDFTVGHDAPNVRIWLKLLAPLFRSQSVVSTTLELMSEQTSSLLRVTMRCANGLAKQFDLSYEEVMPLNAMYDVEQCAHRLCADARILLDCVHNLPHTEHELMLSVTPSELIVKNDVDDSAAEKSVRTEMSVAPADLQEWSIGALATQPLRISFATKEFKAMLHLAESSGTPISAHFDQGGKPLIVAAHVGDGPERVRLECVIATLIDQSAAADELFGDDGEFGAAYNPQQLGVSTPSQSQPDGGMCARDGEQVDSAFAPTYNAASAQPFGVTCSGGGERVRACGTGSQPAAETAAMRNIADTINSLSRLCPDEQLLQQPQQPPRATDPISSFPASRQMAASGRTAAERAHEALEVLPAAPGVMQASPSAGDAVRAGHRPTLALAGAPDGSDTDNDDDAVGATPPDSPPSKRPCAGFVEQFALPTGPSCRTLA